MAKYLESLLLWGVISYSASELEPVSPIQISARLLGWTLSAGPERRGRHVPGPTQDSRRLVPSDIGLPSLLCQHLVRSDLSAPMGQLSSPKRKAHRLTAEP